MKNKPLSRECLLKQGKCCSNGCSNCPYRESNMRQGKTEQQYIDSITIFCIAAAGLFLTMLVAALMQWI